MIFRRSCPRVQGGSNRGSGCLEGRVPRDRLPSGGRSAGAQLPVEIQQQRRDERSRLEGVLGRAGPRP